MIVRYLVRRVIGALLRLGRTLRGRERHSTPKMGTGPSGSVLGPHGGAQGRTGGRRMRTFTEYDREDCAEHGHHWDGHRRGREYVKHCRHCGARQVEDIEYEEEH